MDGRVDPVLSRSTFAESKRRHSYGNNVVIADDIAMPWIDPSCLCYSWLNWPTRLWIL